MERPILSTLSSSRTGVVRPTPSRLRVVLPFRRVVPVEVEPFVNAIPLYDLKVAAGRFSGEQVVDEVPQQAEIESPSDYEWVSYDGGPGSAKGLFVAQVLGESMNKRIPNVAALG